MTNVGGYTNGIVPAMVLSVDRSILLILRQKLHTTYTVSHKLSCFNKTRASPCSITTASILFDRSALVELLFPGK